MVSFDRSLSRACVHAVLLAGAALAASGCSGGGASPSAGTPVALALSAVTSRTASTGAGPTYASGMTAMTAATAAIAPTAATSSYPSAVRANAPLVFYRLNEASGNAVVDSSGNGHNAKYYANVILNQPALLLDDPTAKSVSFPSGFVREAVTWTKQAVSAECWVKPSASDLSASARIMNNAWTDHSGNGFMLWISAGTAAFNTGWLGVHSTHSLAAGKTYHLVGTFDVASGATLYVNGVAVASQRAGGAVPNPQIGDSENSYIGVLNATSGGFGFTDYFRGNVSDCAIYDHALSPSDIAAHYTAGAKPRLTGTPTPAATSSPTPAVTTTPTPAASSTPTPAVTTTPTPAATGTPLPTHSSYVSAVRANAPLVYYRMNDSSGTTAVDSSGNAHNATYKAGVGLNGSALLASDPTSRSASFPSSFASENVTWTKQAVSAECWVKPTANDLSASSRIMNNAWTDHSGNGFMLWISAGTAAFNAGWLGVHGTYALSAGHTYHLVGTFDVASGATLYINGVAVSNQRAGGAVPNPQIGDSTTSYIGVLNATSGGFGFTDYFGGNVSDCAIYDHALSASDIAAHYNAGAQTHVVPVPLPTATVVPTPPAATPPPAPIAYNANTACINHRLFTNDVLPAGEGEFGSNGLDRTWWGRLRGNPVGGNQYSGFRVSWGRHQYDTYFGDVNDGISSPSDDPFSVGRDTAVPGSPQGVRIAAFPMPSHLVGNPAVGGARYYSGVLDTPVNQQYGFFVARVRVPAPAPGMSPAFWLLTNNGVPQGPHGPLNGEWDVQEMFGNDLGNGMNAGNLQWNSGSGTPQNWGGTYSWPPTGIAEASTPSGGYHDYGVLLSPGGAVISRNDYGPGGPGYVYGPVAQGETNYLDGVPLHGSTGGADMTQGVGWKELFAMFQVGPQGGWLGSPVAKSFPAYYWAQWIRVYRPTAASC